MSSLRLYRASAGSGKTHALATTYLELAFQDPDQFGQILAITFTNKAVEEIKQRIIAHLHILAQPSPDKLHAFWMERGWDRAVLQRKARHLLVNVLHRYDRFAVYTIDGFFQRVVREFARELGLEGRFSVLLDTASVMEEVVRSLIATAPDEDGFFSYCVGQMAKDRTRCGKKWHPERALIEMGLELFKDCIPWAQTNLSHENLREVHKVLIDAVERFEKTMQAIGQRALASLQKDRLEIEDFAYGKAGPVGYFGKLASGKAWKPGARVLRASESSKCWYTPASAKADRLQRIVETTLQPLLSKAIAYYARHHVAYYSQKAACSLFHVLGGVYAIRTALAAYKCEQGAVFVSDITALLQQVVSGSETPYVYEKIGSFYKHFLIDEFQDVSQWQWQSLSPLIENSVAEGHQSLLVGDVKQAIYRWRGGSAHTLFADIASHLPAENVVYLSKNWRSKHSIVAFNNQLFVSAATQLTAHFEQMFSEAQDVSASLTPVLTSLADAYQDVVQTAVHTDEGYVEVCAPKEKCAQNSLADQESALAERLSTRLEAIQEAGFKWRDVVFLVRTHAEASKLHRLMADRGYPLSTTNAVRLCPNPWIDLTLSALRCLAEFDDANARFVLLSLYQLYMTSEGDLAHTPEAVRTFATRFDAQAAALSSLPLSTMVAALFDLLGLWECSEAHLFAQVFQDKVTESHRTGVHTASEFLAWWERNGVTQQVAPLSKDSGIQILTIHQAKGLEFPVVILPFCHWSLDHPPQRPPLLWTQAVEEPLCRLGRFPVRYGSHLRDTTYVKDYCKELMQAHLDNLNLLYVACTRPTDRLYLFLPPIGASGLQSTADFVHQYCNTHTKGTWQSDTCATERIFFLGTPGFAPQPSEPDEPSAKPFTIALDSSLSSLPHLAMPLLKVQLRGHMYWVREVLRRIEHASQLERLLCAVAQEGTLSPPEIEKIRSEANTVIKDPRIAQTFVEPWRCMDSSRLWSSCGKMLQPDRIVTHHKQVVAFNFRTDPEVADDASYGMLQMCKTLLIQMGYDTAEAYVVCLWQKSLIKIDP